MPSDKELKSTWTEEQQKEKKELVKKVMGIHDSTMVFMDEIHHKLEALNQIKSTLDSTSAIPMDSAIQLLTQADEDMMNWMRKYREPKDTLQFEKAKAYLQKEEAKIAAIEKLTSDALNYAELLIESNHAKDSIH